MHLSLAPRSLCALAATAFVVLAALASHARAEETLGLEPGGAIEARSTGAITLDALGFDLECELTLSGSLETEDIDSLSEAPIGSITSARVGSCTGGTVTLLAERGNPWDLVYDTQVGSFPDEVTGYRIWMENVDILGSISGLASCLYTGRIPVELDTTYLPQDEEDLTSSIDLATIVEREQSYGRPTLLRGIACPESPVITGAFTLSPETTVVQRNTRPAAGLLPETGETPISSITFTSVNQIIRVRVKNVGRAAIAIHPDKIPYSTRPEKFETRTPGGSGCVRSKVLGSGQTCIVDIRSLVGGSVTASLGIDIAQSSTKPFITGTLNGPA